MRLHVVLLTNMSPLGEADARGPHSRELLLWFKFCKKEYSFLSESASICRLLCLGRTECIEKSTRLFVIKCGHLLGPTALKSAHGLVGGVGPSHGALVILLQLLCYAMLTCTAKINFVLLNHL